MAWTGNGVLVIRCKQMRAVERSVEERHPCYTPYSCFGLWRAFQRWWRAWCSAVYCVCGVPLSVVGAPDRIPPPCSCLGPLRHPLPHLTDSPHLFECVLMAASAHMLETVASSRNRLSRLERSAPMTSPCLRQRWGAARSDGAAARKCPHTVTHTPWGNWSPLGFVGGVPYRSSVSHMA